jgi:hypothetical protein
MRDSHPFIMKRTRTILRNVSCGSPVVYRCFEGTCCLCLQRRTGRRGSKFGCSFLGFLYYLVDGGSMFLRNVGKLYQTARLQIPEKDTV